jgi:septum formation protein
MAYQLILASASPRRKDLLERIGFAVKTVPADLEETIKPEEEPTEFVKRMARSKVLAVVQRLKGTMGVAHPQETLPAAAPAAKRASSREPPSRWVVGADTIVVLNGEILGKPKDLDQGFEMLQKLNGKEHVVITGFCVVDMMKNKEGIQAVVSTVKMKKMSRPEIEKYLSVGESLDKAGAYAVQGVGSYLIDRVVGSYSNVVGLPLCQLMEMFEEMGATDVLPY